jgi:hypothetical protein
VPVLFCTGLSIVFVPSHDSAHAEKYFSPLLHFLKHRLYCAALAQTALSGQDEAGEQPNSK